MKIILERETLESIKKALKFAADECADKQIEADQLGANNLADKWLDIRGEFLQALQDLKTAPVES